MKPPNPTIVLDDGWYSEKDCYSCGKHFVLTGCLKDYAYKKQKNGKMVYFCSWGCLRETERGTKRKKKKKKKKLTGFVRKVDRLGRVVIPKEVREIHQWEEGSPIEMYVEGDKIILQKADTVEEEL